MRLAEKIVVPRQREGNRIQRKFDQAATPFVRLCATHCLQEDVKLELTHQQESTNPRQLRQEIYDDLLCLSRLPSADPTLSEDAYQTLFQHVAVEVEHLFTPKVVTIVGD